MFETDSFCMGRMGTNKRKVDAVAGDPAFERWLARQLHKMYDEVLAEEVPAELLRAVDRATGEAPSMPPEDDGAADAERPPAGTRRGRR